MDIGQQIQAVRKSKGITQAEMAEKLKVTQSNYSRHEKRGNAISFQRVIEIAEAMGVSVSEIINYGVVDALVDKELKKFRERYMTMFANSQARLFKFIKLYIEDKLMIDSNFLGHIFNHEYFSEKKSSGKLEIYEDQDLNQLKNIIIYYLYNDAYWSLDLQYKDIENPAEEQLYLINDIIIQETTETEMALKDFFRDKYLTISQITAIYTNQYGQQKTFTKYTSNISRRE